MMNGVIDMTRKELKEAMARYLSDGGKITKLPDGPVQWHSYSVRVPPTSKVDLTVGVDPANKSQEAAFEKASL